ncbi:hypothetical protein RDWZM_009178, partial [Blomia tropicalis]
SIRREEEEEEVKANRCKWGMNMNEEKWGLNIGDRITEEMAPSNRSRMIGTEASDEAPANI